MGDPGFLTTILGEDNECWFKITAAGRRAKFKKHSKKVKVSIKRETDGIYIIFKKA